MRKHQGEVVAAGGLHRRMDAGPLAADFLRAAGLLAAMPPAMTDAALVADAGLVLEPEFNAFVGMRLADRLQSAAKLFFKAQFANRRRGLAIAALRHAPGDG